MHTRNIGYIFNEGSSFLKMKQEIRKNVTRTKMVAEGRRGYNKCVFLLLIYPWLIVHFASWCLIIRALILPL